MDAEKSRALYQPEIDEAISRVRRKAPRRHDPTARGGAQAPRIYMICNMNLS